MAAGPRLKEEDDIPAEVCEFFVDTLESHFDRLDVCEMDCCFGTDEVVCKESEVDFGQQRLYGYDKQSDLADAEALCHVVTDD